MRIAESPAPAECHGCGAMTVLFIDDETGHTPSCSKCLMNIHYSLHARMARAGIRWEEQHPGRMETQEETLLHDALHAHDFVEMFPNAGRHRG